VRPGVNKVLAYSIFMAARKRKICDEGDLLVVIEKEIANDSDSDVECVPELSSSSSACGTTRINRGFPRDTIEEAKMLKKGEVTFHRKQNVLLLSLQDKRLANMVSTLHTAAIVDDTSRHTGKTKEIPKYIVHYNTYMHGVDSADQ
jgi:hypothetical protein